MAADFLAQLMGDQTRAKVLRVFALNESRALTAADAAKRVGLGVKAAEEEIAYFEKIGLLKQEHLSIVLKNNASRTVSAAKQRTPAWILNPGFKHARALSAFIHEISPVQHETIIGALRRGAKLAAVILSGNFMGDPTRPADLIVAGDIVNEGRLDEAVRELEPQFGREIRYAAFSTPEFRYRLTVQDRLIRDTLDYPHLVLLDRTRLL